MGQRREQRTRIALPVKVHTRDENGKPQIEVACTMDIAPKGARLAGVRSVSQPGDIVCVERGKNKAFYRVMWIGTREDGRPEQVGLQCVEPDAEIWGMTLMGGEDERYETIKKAGSGDALAERQRKMRYSCSGAVQIFKEGHTVHAQYGELGDISSVGCYVRMGSPLPSGTKVRMSLRVPRFELEFTVRGRVGMSDKAIGMWVEFSEIASYDAPILGNLIKKLSAAAG
jgi:PilZ domain-containing protein